MSPRAFYGAWTILLVAMAPVAAAAPVDCSSAFSRIFGKPTADIRLVFGYKDARPARFVGDRYERMMVIRRLMAPCVADQSVCGFRRDPGDAELFLKDIPGETGDTTVRLRVVASSAGPDDDANREDPFQSWLSRRAEQVFLSGLQFADVVFYLGHSRSGGGPDFTPPRLDSAQHADYAWYKAQAPGLKRMLESLARADIPPRWIGLFSCVSERHFLEASTKALPRSVRGEVGFITSDRLLYYWDSLQNALAALSAVLGKRCEPALSGAVYGDAQAGP
ncbi:MAG: hypothetical protein AB7P04_10690 [Bacteriovoracia bacterium]